MKYIFQIFVLLVLQVVPISAEEAYVSLEEYTRKAIAIAIVEVEKDNSDGSVTVNTTEVFKGSLGAKEVIRGETGFCEVRGSVNRFMIPKNKYLVFLFEDNTVGRLGGILRIEEDKTLLINFINGFTGITLDQKTFSARLPVEEGRRQIKTFL